MKVSEVIRIIREDGWVFSSQKGSHRHFTHPSKSGKVTIAGKPSLEMHPKTLSSIFKQAQIERPKE